MRRFNIAPWRACVQCQQWHWPPWGKVCMCVNVCVGGRSGVRKPTAEKLPHRGSYLPVSGPTWEVWHQWNYTDSGTEGRRERKEFASQIEGGEEREGEQLMRRESLFEKNQSIRRRPATTLRTMNWAMKLDEVMKVSKPRREKRRRRRKYADSEGVAGARR